MKRTVKMKIEIDVEVIIDFMPERAAPVCSNPSSPLYSDCGDDMECDIVSAYLIAGGTKLKIDGLFLVDLFTVGDNYENLCEIAQQDYAEENYDREHEI